MSGLSDALRQLRVPAERDQGLIIAAADALDRFELKQRSDHQATMHMIQTLRDTFIDEKAAWQAEREKHDQDLGRVIDQRDEYHDMADRLAQAIADYFLAPIGEHSSSNCPWMRALELIENPPQPLGPDLETQMALADAPRSLREYIADLQRFAARQQQDGGSDA